MTGSFIGSLWRPACWNPDMARAAEELDVDGIAVRVTNRDKVYFPKLGSKGTKGRLVDYYLAVAGGPMLFRCAIGPPICSVSRTASTARRSTRRGCRSTIPTICRPVG